MPSYLIMACEPFDEYETEIDRTPITIVDDWRKWAEQTTPGYRYEVWLQDDDKEFLRVKAHDQFQETGMALYYWTKDEDPEETLPHIIEKFPGTNNRSPIPQIVLKVAKQTGVTFEVEHLEEFGNTSWYNTNGDHYVYGYYQDYIFDAGS